MTLKKLRVLSAALCFIFVAVFAQAQTQVTSTDNESGDDEALVKVRIDTLKNNGEDLLVLSFRNAEGWHTYWKNPGDSGLPTEFHFKIDDKKINLEEKEWPSPKLYIEAGDIWTFGYSNDYSFFFNLPDSFLNKDGKNLEIHSKWLVCKDICIPEEIHLQASVEDGKLVAKSPAAFNMIPDILRKRFNNLPKDVEFPSELDMVLAKDPSKENGLLLYTNISKDPDHQIMEDTNVLTPFRVNLLEFKREELYLDSNENLYVRTPIDWDGQYKIPPIELPEDGKFKEPLKLKFLYANPKKQEMEVIEKTFEEFSLTSAQRLEDFKNLLTPVGPWTEQFDKDTEQSKENPKEITTSQEQKRSTWMLILFAFMGGLILNLMPCVLPVISLKIFSLIQHSKESRSRILKHNLAYTLGVVSTFWVIAGAVLVLKSAGESVGWGFQLQSPSFVATMAFIIFIFSLNMFGLFEFGTPGGRTLGGVELKSGFSGDFFSGVLATILSTPCSAPFLGTALTFAFTSPPQIIFLILSFVGLGLATPFILTGIFPTLIKIFPKPGMWMDHFKKFLALTLILTCVWLMDVYAALVSGSVAILQLQTAMVLVFFGLYMRAKITNKKRYYVPVLLLSLLLFSTAFQANLEGAKQGESTLLNDKINEGLPWQKWSKQRMQELANEEKLVFMDFTAKWCLTCKVNERLVINTNRFKELREEYNVELLLADWTKRDANIGDFLQSHGLVGVPAYFIQLPDGTLINLGETISFKKLEDNFKKAL